MKIGERIKALRTQNKVTQTELADMLGTTKQTIFKYENGIVTNIPSDKIAKMAEIFKVSPSHIMGWEEVQKNNDAIADIIIRLRTDKDFSELVLLLYNMEKSALSDLKSFLQKSNN